jgi:hypothetical protein
MALANVQGYLASDGKFFFKNESKETEAYERVLEFRRWCSDNICRGGEWSSHMVAQAILEHWQVTPKA